MDVYTVTAAFDQVPDNLAIQVGDTIGKLAGDTIVTVNSVEYTNDAFYAWVGSANSLNFMTFTGTVPDPATGSGVPTTPVAAPATPTSAGTQGTWAFDGTYMYWCRATNTWVRWVVVKSW